MARPLRPATKRHVILFLAANPRSSAYLALDEECAEIERELRMTTGRDDFDVRSKWAVSVDEMMRHLNQWRPTIVHFSGHCGGSGDAANSDGSRRNDSAANRDIGAATDTGIQLQNEQRQPQHVSAMALTKMIKSASSSAKVVVLNACFGNDLADALLDVVDCVVGMRGAIGDDAARTFAVGFYRALGNRSSIGNAVEQAVATLAAKQLPGEDLPVCRTRKGVLAEELFLSHVDATDLSPLLSDKQSVVSSSPLGRK